MVQHAFVQGYLDSLCGTYAIVNAEKIINKSNDEDSQKLFNEIIEYLSRKKILKNAIINGMNHRLITRIMTDVVGDRIPYKTTNWRYYTLKEWWNACLQHLTEKENSGILLSVRGREDHITFVKSMTERTIYLVDSGAWGGIKTIRRSSCKLYGSYFKEDKYLISATQTWFLSKE